MISLFLAALVSPVAGIPKYNTIPEIDQRGVGVCLRQHQRLAYFVNQYKHRVDEKEIRRGGKYTWDEVIAARHAGDVVARPYLEEIRSTARTGDGQRCIELYQEGRMKVITDVIAPLFGK